MRQRNSRKLRIATAFFFLTIFISILFAAPLIADDEYDLGKKAYGQKEYSTAERYFQKAYEASVRKNKTDKIPKRLFYLARTQYQLQKYGLALENLTKLKQQFPDYNPDRVKSYLDRSAKKAGKETKDGDSSTWQDQKQTDDKFLSASHAQSLVEKAVSEKIYFLDLSGKLSEKDRETLTRLAKQAQDKGFTLYMYAVNVQNYQDLQKITATIPKRYGFQSLELLVLLAPNPRGGFAVGSDYISREKQQKIANESLRVWRQTPPEGRTAYGVVLETFAEKILNKSNFKQSLIQTGVGTTILIVLAVVGIVGAGIYAARKLKQKKFRDLLESGRDLLFAINDRHSHLEATNAFFINWSTKLDELEKQNNWKKPQELERLIAVMQSYLAQPNQSKEDLERPLFSQDLGNIRIEKMRRQDGKEYFCYSTGEPITSPEIYIATISQKDGTELRVTLSDAVAQEVIKNPKSLHVRTYEHDGQRLPWYEIPNYRYDPYDRAWQALMWYNLGSMMNRPHYHDQSHYHSGSSYPQHSYHVSESDYGSYESLESTPGVSFADSMSADSADQVAGASFSSRESGSSDVAGSSFSYQDNS